MKRIHWTDLPGNKYLKKIEPAMLKNRCIVRQTIKPIGNKRDSLPQKIEVFYDRDYVMARLLIDVIQPLQIDSLERLIALVTDAWNESKNTSLNYDEYKAG